MTDRRNRIDDAIDRAVRDLTHRDPRPGLRRRVLAGIAAPARRSALIGRLAFAAGSLAMVVLTVLLVRGGDPADETRIVSSTPPVVNPAPARTPAAAPQPPVAAPAPASRRQPASATSRPAADAPRIARSFGPPRGRVSATSLADDDPAPIPAAAGAAVPPADGAAAAPGIAPIAIAPLTTRPIDLPAIRIVPLQIAPLHPPR